MHKGFKSFLRAKDLKPLCIRQYPSGEGRTSDISLIASYLSEASVSRNVVQLGSWHEHK